MGGEGGEEAAIALGEFIDMNANLKKLGISGTKGSRFRSTIVSFFPFLARNQSLEELDLEGNKIGDEAFLALTQILRANKNLKVLNIDDNDISINGFMALLVLVRFCKNLQVPYPQKDVDQNLETITEAKKKLRFREIIDDIQFTVRTNAASRQAPSTSDDIPTTIAPVAQLPEHLATFQTFNEFMSSKETLRPFRPVYETDIPEGGETKEKEPTEDEHVKSEDEDEEEERKVTAPTQPKPSQSQAVAMRCIALYDYTPKEDNELGFKENDTIILLEKFENNDWYKGQGPNGKIGKKKKEIVTNLFETKQFMC